MNIKVWIVVGIVLLAIGMMIGFPIGKSCGPEVKVGVETTMVKIIVHDTITTEKPNSEISAGKKIIYVPKYIYVDSSKTTDTVQVADTSICYSFEENEKDGAYIKAEMCSDSLPANKPLDLRGTLIYKAPPDTEKHIMRIDTVMKNNKLPFYKDWKTYTIGLLAAVIAGMFVAGR